MLITHHLQFTATATTPLELDEQAGGQLRGAIVGALWERFCANKAAPTCAACPLFTVCPVAALVAPMREAGETGGEQRPRPYVTRPPVGQRYTPGAPLTFGLALFGPAAALFPYVVLAAQELERHGLGRRLAENRGQRGRVQLRGIDAVQPLTGAQQALYRHGERTVQAPGLPVTAEDVVDYAAMLPDTRLTLRFSTPLRLIEQKQLVKSFRLRPFVQRLKDRLSELVRAYGDGSELSRLDFDDLERSIAVEDHTRWVDVVGYSSRQRRALPLGGLVGTATLTGELGPLRELLVWGSLIHVGKNAVKGDGWYAVSG